jgi:hypothetical protein
MDAPRPASVICLPDWTTVLPDALDHLVVRRVPAGGDDSVIVW